MSKLVKPKPTPEQRQHLAKLARQELARQGILFSSVTGKEYDLRGDCRELVRCTDHNVILSGPRDTGKTVAACLKAHSLCMQYRGCQGVIGRKVGVDLYGSVLQTFGRIVKDSGVRPYGGEKPQWYDYPNGSRIWVCGLDKPGKALSSERDFIYINQAEELKLDDWETLSGSCSGRNAVIPHPQLFGDCNPGGSKHWIKTQAAASKLRLLFARHRDNPTIYDTAGNLTSGGAIRIAVLEKLSGVRRKRLYEGIWATSEGAVYDMFDSALGGPHVRVRSPLEMRRWFLAIDEGYTNPAVILLIGADADNRWHCFREFYRPGVLQSVVVSQARSWFLNPAGYAITVPGEYAPDGQLAYAQPAPKSESRCEKVVVDAAAAGLIADLNNAGITAVGAKGRVLDGINAVQNRLKVLPDGHARYSVDPSCINHINEFESYVWKPEKDMPEKENDHSADALRYLVDSENEPTGAFGSASELQAPEPPELVAAGMREIEFDPGELGFDENETPL